MSDGYNPEFFKANRASEHLYEHVKDVLDDIGADPELKEDLKSLFQETRPVKISEKLGEQH